jgi:hypothetical protein
LCGMRALPPTLLLLSSPNSIVSPNRSSTTVQLVQTDRGQFHFHRVVFSSHLKSKVDLALTKAAALRVNLNLDGAPITSKSHTHPSHSQTSRLSTSSLSLGVPVPRSTQCM